LELCNINDMVYSLEDFYDNERLTDKIPNPNPFDDSKVIRISKDFIELLESDDVLMEEFSKRYNLLMRSKKLKKLKNK